MFKLKYPFGSGTKEDPFRVPFVPPNKTGTAIVPKAKIFMASSHGPDDPDLYLFSSRSEKFIGVGGLVMEDVPGLGVRAEVPFYCRSEMEGDIDTVTVRAFKFKGRSNSGQLISGYRLMDQKFASDKWGEMVFFCTPMSVAEYDQYLSDFVTPAVEPGETPEEPEIDSAEVGADSPAEEQVVALKATLKTVVEALEDAKALLSNLGD